MYKLIAIAEGLKVCHLQVKDFTHTHTYTSRVVPFKSVSSNNHHYSFHSLPMYNERLLSMSYAPVSALVDFLHLLNNIHFMTATKPLHTRNLVNAKNLKKHLIFLNNILKKM